MVLKFKNRSENPRKKVLIYGLDGTGKSTYASKYCKEHNLNPVVIDIDDTNYTALPILDLNFRNDLETYKTVKDTIKEIGKSDYDTIILDGVSSLLEMLTSKAKGQAKYSDRAMRWNEILFQIENTKKNVIYIGQIDCDMLWTEDYQPAKAIIKLNSQVNEKYYCFIDEKGNYEVESRKMRTLEEIESKAHAEPSVFKPANEHKTERTIAEVRAEKIIAELRSDWQEINKPNAKKVLMDKVMQKKMTVEESNEVWTALEVLLNGE